MSLPLVSLCGHTGTKLYNLHQLYLGVKPKEPHFLQVTFNGVVDDYARALAKELEFPLMHVINHPTGRDVRMHWQAIERWRMSCKDRSAWGIFLNDDVVCMEDPRWFDQAKAAMEAGFDLLGYQPNLACMTTMEYLKCCPSRDRGNIQRFGRAFRFIRTHAFACRIDWFERSWKISNETAQRFEKDTLLRSKFALVDDFTAIMDSNTHRHVAGIREWQNIERWMETHP